MVREGGREEKGGGREGREEGGIGGQRSACRWIRLAGCGWLVKGVWEEGFEK